MLTIVLSQRDPFPIVKLVIGFQYITEAVLSHRAAVN